MRILLCTLALAAALLNTACSTSQSVTAAPINPGKRIVTVSLVAEDGNSPEMDHHLVSALQRQGLSVRAPLPQGTVTAPGVDALVSYVDVWRWDVVMYLKSITIQMRDAKTGAVLASGAWKDSPLHGFRNSGTVVQNLVSEVVAKVRAGR